jgi:1,4-dihydroxy-2-naphthoyl-CoA hydrolase
MPFSYSRQIHFRDTDAARAVFFANYLALCHEAYEESLQTSGLKLADLFSTADLMVPIAKSEAEYLRPLHVGDWVRVEVRTELLSENSFAVKYEVHHVGPPEKLAARLRTEHVCTPPGSANALRYRSRLLPGCGRVDASARNATRFSLPCAFRGQTGNAINRFGRW